MTECNCPEDSCSPPVQKLVGHNKENIRIQEERNILQIQINGKNR